MHACQPYKADNGAHETRSAPLAARRQSTSAKVSKAVQWPAKPALSGKPTRPRPPSRTAALFHGMRAAHAAQALQIRGCPPSVRSVVSPAADVHMLIDAQAEKENGQRPTAQPGCRQDENDQAPVAKRRVAPQAPGVERAQAATPPHTVVIRPNQLNQIGQSVCWSQRDRRTGPAP